MGTGEEPLRRRFCRGGRLWRFPFSKRTEFIQLEEQARRRGGRDGGRFRGRRFGAIGLPTYIILEPNTLRQPPPGPTAKG